MLFAAWNWLKLKFINSYIFFYTNIYILTEHKQNPQKIWMTHVLESIRLLNRDYLKLLGCTFWLWLSGKALKAQHLIENFPKVIYAELVHLKEMIIFFFKNPSAGGDEDHYVIFFDSTTPLARNFSAEKVEPEELDNPLETTTIFWVLYSFLKTTLIALVIAMLLGIYLIIFFQVALLKQLAIWLVVGLLFFWLMSGFNFFLKRYAFGKFTSATKRFWKRANMCFWLVEGFLFLLFYYYYLNSSQEPLYMYDYSSLNQDYLLPLDEAFNSLFNLIIFYILLKVFMLRLNYLQPFQTILFIIVLTTTLFKIFFVESYQFYYVITAFNEYVWDFNVDLGEWQLNPETPRLRAKTYYFLLCLIAKYWHFIFIFFGWVFFCMKFFETKKLSYDLLSYNIQNILILYVLNILTYTQWIKWLSKRYFDLAYYWFFTHYDHKSIWGLLSEIKTLTLNFFSSAIFSGKKLFMSFTLISNNTFSSTSYFNSSFIFI